MSPLTRNTLLGALVVAINLSACAPSTTSESAPSESSPTSTTTGDSTSTEPTATPPSQTIEERRALPAPTGGHAVGVRDLGTVGTSQLRAWYPAQADTGSPADYFTPGVADAFGIDPTTVTLLEPHARRDARPAAEPMPVVVLTAGWASTVTLSTALAENLASHGHLVIGLDPLLGTEDPQTAPDDVDGTRRTADISAAIDHLAEPGLIELVGPPDTTTIIVGGHSFGGATAFEAAFLDDRIDAVFNLDGTLHRRAATEAVPVPALTIAGNAETAVQAPLAERSEGFALVEVDTSHYGFTDAPLLATTNAEVASLVGTTATEGRAAETTVAIVTRFVGSSSRPRPASASELTTDLDLATPVA